jgi:hypothetical protein
MTLDQEIQALVAEFNDRLRHVVLQRTADLLGTALDTAHAGSARGAEANGHGPSTIAKGEKRKPADLAQLTEAVVAIVEVEPGLRVEEIAARLTGKGHPGLERGAAASRSGPLKKAMATRRIKKTGRLRGTRYFPRAKRG